MREEGATYLLDDIVAVVEVHGVRGRDLIKGKKNDCINEKFRLSYTILDEENQSTVRCPKKR